VLTSLEVKPSRRSSRPPLSRRRGLAAAILLIVAARVIAPGFCLMRSATSPTPHACCGTGLRAQEAPCCTTSDPALKAAHMPLRADLSGATADLPDDQRLMPRPSPHAVDNTHSPPQTAVLRI
jgi:hypothetical protein